MRLIESQTLRFKEFQGDDDVPPYAILSHTWGEDEVTYQDMLRYLNLFNSGSLQYRPVFNEKDRLLNVPILPGELQGFDKIRQTAKLACADSLDYFWIDTCCIDKKSSAELSEAINSMFRWYKNSVVCYAFLVDIHTTTFNNDLGESRWFQRGWTLQELIAPSSVIFFNQDWRHVGSKKDHVEKLAEFTGIHELVLQHSYNISDHSVAQRMCWASTRKTTRVEDIAYCLLGIFDLNMPLLYGEGEKAFMRLQEEIIKKRPDDSIFAWGLAKIPHPPLGTLTTPNPYRRFLPAVAPSPGHFKYCRNIESGEILRNSFKVINHSIEIELPLVQLPGSEYSGGDIWFGLLSCRISSRPPNSISKNQLAFLAVLLGNFDVGSGEVLRRACSDIEESVTFLISPKVAAQAIWKTVTILQNPDSMIYGSLANSIRAKLSHVVFNTKSLEHLGYKISMCYCTRPLLPRQKFSGNWDAELETLTISSDWDAISYSSMFHMHSSEGYPRVSLAIWVVKVNDQWNIGFVVRKRQLQHCDDAGIIANKELVVGQSICMDDPQEAIFVQTAEGKVGRLTFVCEVKSVFQVAIYEINISIKAITT